jgi:hypothetical protein
MDKEIKTKISNKQLAFYIAFIYVGLGTIYSLTYWTASSPLIFNETLGSILLCIFLPTSFISIVILFTERDPGIMLFVTQTITLGIIWGLVYLIISKIRKEKTP